MPETMQKSWVAFSVSGKIGEQGCLPLLRTGHATHVESVLDMFRTRAIRSELVADGSRLDTERTKVVFTSPHDWSKPWGCMFGTVVLQLNWAKVTEDKNFYWIGGKEYKTTRPRILITDREYPRFKRYLPGLRNGPWWRSKNENDYWNGYRQPEFLLEGDVPLDQVSWMTFVDGHPDTCRTKSGCPDKSHDKATAATRLLAGACHRGLLPACRDLWVHKVNEPRKALRDAWKHLRAAILDGQQWNGNVTTADAKAKPLAWSALGAIYHRQRDYKRELLKEFKGPNNAIRACASLIEDALQLKKRTLPKE